MKDRKRRITVIKSYLEFSRKAAFFYQKEYKLLKRIIPAIVESRSSSKEGRSTTWYQHNVKLL